MNTGDPRNRPVVLRTEPASAATRRRLPRTLLGIIAIALFTTVGAAAGSWSVWSVVGSTAPTGEPTPPLWFSPPALERGTSPSNQDAPTTQTGRGPGDNTHLGPGRPGSG